MVIGIVFAIQLEYNQLISRTLIIDFDFYQINLLNMDRPGIQIRERIHKLIKLLLPDFYYSDFYCYWKCNFPYEPS